MSEATDVPTVPAALPAGGTEPAVLARGVVKYYDEGVVPALNGVDLTVGRGEFVAITGPSGCGKSTMLHLFAALDVPTSGTIVINGYDLAHLRAPDRFRREEIGLVFQLHNLLPRLSVVDNVEIAMLGSRRHRAERAARARELLAAVDLLPFSARRPPQLSGGERQRVAIARALANDPAVLLADEPTGSLDSASVETVLALFTRLQTERGLTIVLVTHDQAVASAAGRVVHMLDGRIVEA
ncbi:MAG TPA: ABC transporter ATP-binding protein [Acidimicrobiales bacterium]|nr:ABC transporter ATP-binding protein [Acidimicrobiales bacterium]